MDTQYTPSQLAEKLHISVPTLRKYSLLIEEAANDSNYFPRNHQNVRSYTEKDLQDIQELVDYSKQNNLTLQKAANKIFGAAEPKADKTTTSTKSNESHATLAAQVSELSAQLKQTTEAVAVLTKRLDNIEATTSIVEVAHDDEEQEPQVLKTISLTPKNAPKTESATADSEAEETATTDSGLNFTEPVMATPAPTEAVVEEATEEDDQRTSSEESEAVTEETETTEAEADVEATTASSEATTETSTEVSADEETTEKANETNEESETSEDSETENAADTAATELSTENNEPEETATETEAVTADAEEENTTLATTDTQTEEQETDHEDGKKKSWWQKMLKK